MLWRCWLRDRKGIRPVKNWVVGCWRGYLSWSDVQACIWPSWCHCHSLSLASVKSRLVLPFWYRLTWVVPEKGPLNGVCVYQTKFLTSYGDTAQRVTKTKLAGTQQTSSPTYSFHHPARRLDCRDVTTSAASFPNTDCGRTSSWFVPGEL